MRRVANVIVVGAVAALVVAAITASFLTGGDEAAKPANTAEAATTEPAEEPIPAAVDDREGAELRAIGRRLEEEGVLGTLSVITEDCEFEVFRLPELVSVKAQRPRGCAFPVSPGEPSPAGHPAFQPFVSPGPRCETGCAYAWTPRGTVTFVRAGGGGRAAPGLWEGRRPVRTRDSLAERSRRGTPWRIAPAGPATRLALRRATARDRTRRLVELLLRRARGARRKAAHGPASAAADELSLVRVSPSRRFAAVRSTSLARIVVVPQATPRSPFAVPSLGAAGADRYPCDRLVARRPLDGGGVEPLCLSLPNRPGERGLHRPALSRQDVSLG